MTCRALDVLHQEHRAIARMLDLLDRQVVLLENRLEADIDVLKEVIDYFRTFPDVYHHPKEDLIVRCIARRDPASGDLLSSLADEHEAGSKDLADLSRALVAMLLEPERETPRFVDLARGFIASERRHMAWEDGNFFDIAAASLTNDDWADIERRIVRLGEPRFEHLARERFQHIGTEAARWRG